MPSLLAIAGSLATAFLRFYALIFATQLPVLWMMVTTPASSPSFSQAAHFATTLATTSYTQVCSLEEPPSTSISLKFLLTSTDLAVVATPEPAPKNLDVATTAQDTVAPPQPTHDAAAPPPQVTPSSLHCVWSAVVAELLLVPADDACPRIPALKFIRYALNIWALALFVFALILPDRAPPPTDGLYLADPADPADHAQEDSSSEDDDSDDESSPTRDTIAGYEITPRILIALSVAITSPIFYPSAAWWIAPASSPLFFQATHGPEAALRRLAHPSRRCLWDAVLADLLPNRLPDPTCPRIVNARTFAGEVAIMMLLIAATFLQACCHVLPPVDGHDHGGPAGPAREASSSDVHPRARARSNRKIRKSAATGTSSTKATSKMHVQTSTPSLSETGTGVGKTIDSGSGSSVGKAHVTDDPAGKHVNAAD